LGKKLVHKNCSGIIVETEAYRDDPASHAVTRPKKGVMLRETFGRIYIYLIYGMHYCLNFTTEAQGPGAVLIRALEPLDGIEKMKARRKTDDLRNLTNGPGKLFQALALHPSLHFKRVGQFWPVRVEINHRTLAVKDGQDFVWVWIGSPDEYEQMVNFRLSFRGYPIYTDL
jgi:DNA-3-methyladenine glycosylase